MTLPDDRPAVTDGDPSVAQQHLNLAAGIRDGLAARGYVTLDNDDWQMVCAALEAAAQARSGQEGEVERLTKERDLARSLAAAIRGDLTAAENELENIRHQHATALARATQTAEANERLREVLRRVEDANQALCALRSDTAYFAMIADSGASDAMVDLDAARHSARRLLSDLNTDTAGDKAREDRVDKLEDALREIDKWSQAYSLKVFPEADDAYLTKAHAALQQHGMGIDRISASAMRHAVEGVGEIARRALASETGGRS